MTPKSVLLAQTPALGPGTQQGTDVDIWWTEMKEVGESVGLVAPFFQASTNGVGYLQILGGGTEKRAAISPPWSKVRCWERAETETGPYPILPIRKSGRGQWAVWGRHESKKMPRTMGITLGLWCEETGCQSQLCLLTQFLPFSGSSFPSVKWGGFLSEMRGCPALTLTVLWPFSCKSLSPQIIRHTVSPTSFLGNVSVSFPSDYFWLWVL